jgi:hypothetical protein
LTEEEKKEIAAQQDEKNFKKLESEIKAKPLRTRKLVA